MRGEQPWRTNRARVLRSSSTSAEGRLWSQLRDRRLDGLKFSRQVPIGPWFADFLCRARKVVVEIDGATHASSDEVARDTLRARALEGQGYRIFRVQNGDVYDNLEAVLEALLDFVRDGEV